MQEMDVFENDGCLVASVLSELKGGGGMMKEFLKDATNFEGMRIKKRETCLKRGDKVVVCPVCKGHGGWNLEIDAYGKGRHFQASCGQCNGWGWVEKGSKDAKCVHKYREMSVKEARDKGHEHWGMCYHVYECRKCKQVIAQDSSD